MEQPPIQEKAVRQEGTLTRLWILWFNKLWSVVATVPLSGSGNPNGVVKASPGALYVNISGGAGTTFFVKESGVNTTTGWIGK